MVAPLIPIAALGIGGAVGGTALGTQLGGGGSGSGGTTRQDNRQITEQVTKKDVDTTQTTFSPQTTISPQTDFDKSFNPSIVLDSPQGESSTSVKKQSSQRQSTNPSNSTDPSLKAPVTTRPVQNPVQNPSQSEQNGNTGQTLMMLGLIAGGSYVALNVLGGEQ